MFVVIVEMVVKTRSQVKNTNTGAKILTPSFRTANMRTYKIYTGIGGSVGSGNSAKSQRVPEVEATAADALVSLASYESDSSQLSWSNEGYDHVQSQDEAQDRRNVTATCHTCINPMHPITRYIYRVEVLNSSRTLHYKTAFILYNSANRLYYIYSIISNCYPDSSDSQNGNGEVGGVTAVSMPTPRHTIQLKYTSYTHESIVNYIMTMIVPSKEYDYFIRDDIIGVVSSGDTSFGASVFGEDSSYYDVDSLVYDDSSPHTTNGFKAFQLIPSRNFWFDPLISFPPSIHSSHYSQETVNTILPILSQSY